MKFVLGGVHFARPQSFPSAAAAAIDPLAAAIFALDGVYNVFMAQDFVTVNKEPAVAWTALTEPICAIIERHFVTEGD